MAFSRSNYSAYVQHKSDLTFFDAETVFQVTSDTYEGVTKYFVSHPKFGYSKGASTPERSIQNMMFEAGCNVWAIKEVNEEPEQQAESASSDGFVQHYAKGDVVIGLAAASIPNTYTIQVWDDWTKALLLESGAMPLDQAEQRIELFLKDLFI